MAFSVTSLTCNGLRDWLIQRVSAVILAVYSLFLLVLFLQHRLLAYDQWRGLFASPAMKLFSLLFLLSLILHAYIGMWTVFTDYIKNRLLRLTLHTLVALSLSVFFGWGIAILWSV